MSTDSLVDLIEKFKGDFYQKQNKNIFFKKGQKMDCAKEISKLFSLEDMISKTIYIIPGTNKIIFVYPIFKLYATLENYEKIVQKVLDLYDEILLIHPTYEAHVLLDTFSISAAERYKEAIKLFCSKCMDSSPKYTDLLTSMYIYYTPSMIDSISILLKPFINSVVRDRIILYNKSESESLWKQLTQN
jgi:hypothetical protein